MENEKIVCAECGEEIERENAIEVDGNYYCEDCFDELYVTCGDCGELVAREIAYWVEDRNYYICDHCRAYGGYYYCNHCGDLFSSDSIDFDREDDAYCEDCKDAGFGHFDDDIIADYHDHKDNDSPIFFGGDEDDSNNLFMGIELEIDSDESLRNRTHAQTVKDMFPEDFIYMENDCSLRYGFENITQPATLEYHTLLTDTYRKAFQYYTANGYVSHNKETCGLHVHFNRSFFEDNEEECVTKLCYLFEKFWDNFVKFSRRNERQLNRWAKRYSDAHDEVYKNSKKGWYDRYFAVNLTNYNTIEIRMFRGTLKFESFLATLQMVDTIARFSKEKDITSLRSLSWEDLLVTNELKAYWETVKNR